MAKGAAEVMFLNLQKPDTLRDAPIRKEGGAYVISFDSGEARVQFASESERVLSLSALNVVVLSQFASMMFGSSLDESSSHTGKTYCQREKVACLLPRENQPAYERPRRGINAVREKCETAAR